MTRSSLPILLLCQAACAVGQPARPPRDAPPSPARAEYSVRIEDPSTRRVEVIASFEAPSSGDLKLRIERRYAFLEPQRNFITGLSARDGARPLSAEEAAPDHWRIRTGGARRIEARWSVEILHREDVSARETDKPDRYEHPYVAEDHALLVGAAIFLVPEEGKGPYRVRFEVPAGWPVSAPWPGSPESGFAVPDTHSLLQNYVFLGRARRSTFEIDGLEIEVAVAPRADPPHPALPDAIERIVRAAVALHPSPRSSRFLFAFPEGGLSSGWGGSAKRDSLVLAFGRWATPEDVEHLLAHEFTHTLSPAPGGFADDARYANEGFTDYLAALARRRTGLLTEVAFLREAAGQTERWIATAERTGWSLAAASPRYFEDREAYDMAYAGGFVVGFLLDRLLPGGLPALYSRLASDRSGPLDAAALRRAIEDAGGEPAAAAFRELVEEPAGEGLLQAFPPEVAVRARREIDRRSLGFRFEPGPEPVVARVDTRSPAARAGLRDGDRIVAFDGEPVEKVWDFLRLRRRSRGERFRVSARRGQAIVECEGAYDRRLRVRLSRVDGET